MKWILSSKSGKSKRSVEERREEWNDTAVSQLREKWVGEIQDLSKKWKAIQAEKTASKQMHLDEDSSEGDVDIVAEFGVPKQSPRKKGQNGVSLAARIRG